MTAIPLILVVEDHAAWLERYSRVLAAAGYGTMRAESVNSALGCVRMRLPALVVQDLGLPTVRGRGRESVKNGLFLLQTLRSQHPGLPVIVQSGGLDAAVRRQLEVLNPGGVALSKDDDQLEAKLLAAIARALEPVPVVGSSQDLLEERDAQLVRGSDARAPGMVTHEE